MSEKFSIDSGFARFGNTRYAIDKITSFSTSTRRQKVQGTNDKFSHYLLGVIGIILGPALITAGFEPFNLGLVVGGLISTVTAIWLFVRARHVKDTKTHDQTVFVLSLVTNAGEVAAYETTSADDISSIQTDLERAMLQARGR